MAVNRADVDTAAKEALAPLDSADGAEGPYQVQESLQETMQDNVNIVREEGQMKTALEEIGRLNERVKRVGVRGNREYNPGWHTALDLKNLLTVSEAIARSAIERKESRGGHFRDDYPDKDPTYATFNFVIQKAGRWVDGALARTNSSDAGTSEGRDRGDEMMISTLSTPTAGAQRRREER